MIDEKDLLKYTPEEIARLIGETTRKANRELMVDATIVEIANNFDNSEVPISSKDLLVSVIGYDKVITQTEMIESITRILAADWGLKESAKEELGNILKLKVNN